MNTDAENYSHRLLLHAIIHGFARWEWYDSGRRDCGELCISGMRYSLDCDQQGLPVLTDHVRAKILTHFE